MMLTRYTHSCVRLEAGGRVLVIDPGIWSEPKALRGADAVLITHEHVDHVDALRLAGLQAPVYGPAGVAIAGLDVIAISAEQEFIAAGFRVRAVGGQHAPVLVGGASCANLGYLVEDTLYHPGDALHVPAVEVQMLLVPLQASWLKTAEAVEFVRAIAPERAVGIHDGQLNDRGLASLNAWLAEQGRTDYSWLAPGAVTQVHR